MPTTLTKNTVTEPCRTRRQQSIGLWYMGEAGSGLPAGPGGILGGAEGIAYLVALGGVVVGVMQVTHFGFIPNAIPVEGGPCFSP